MWIFLKSQCKFGKVNYGKSETTWQGTVGHPIASQGNAALIEKQ